MEETPASSGWGWWILAKHSWRHLYGSCREPRPPLGVSRLMCHLGRFVHHLRETGAPPAKSMILHHGKTDAQPWRDSWITWCSLLLFLGKIQASPVGARCSWNGEIVLYLREIYVISVRGWCFTSGRLMLMFHLVDADIPSMEDSMSHLGKTDASPGEACASLGDDSHFT